MALLSEVPTEILLQVCDRLDSWAIHKFARCNKWLYELTERHRYASVSFHHTTSLSNFTYFPTDPLVFLRHILVSPRKASYLKIIRIEPWRKTNIPHHIYHDNSELLYDICTTLSLSEQVSKDKINDIYNIVLLRGCGNYSKLGVVIALILNHCPNVETIKLSGRNLVKPFVRDLFSESFAKADCAIAETGSASVQRPQKPLGKLRKLSWVLIESETSFGDLLHLIRMASLPSLRILKVKNIHSPPESIAQHELGRCTDLQYINFLDSAVSAEHIVALVKQSRCLKEFQYGYRIRSRGHTPWEPPQIVDALLKYAADTLTSLIMDTALRAYVRPTMRLNGGLNGFTVLKRLRMNVSMLNAHFRDRRPLNPLPADARTYKHNWLPYTEHLLPASIEELALISNGNNEQMDNLMNHIIAEKERLPRLRQTRLLEYAELLQKPYVPCATIIDTFEALGVAVKVP